ncbi:MAG: 4Fe-4S binding protein [Spirochaetes bacterium]|nr:4Fe-4S binding protein [Spirochaetota bacterium]
MADKRPQFDYRHCMVCRICLYACPFGCLDDTKTGIDSHGKAYPALAQPERCTGCSLCARSCPLDAIAMKAV